MAERRRWWDDMSPEQRSRWFQHSTPDQLIAWLERRGLDVYCEDPETLTAAAVIERAAQISRT
jgi:hypothetical protein